MTSNSLPPSGSLPSDDLETPELVQPLTVEPVVQASPVLIAVTETNAQEVDDQIIATLASLKPMDYDRLRRDQAKALDIQVKTLDEMVKAARDEHDQTAHLPFVEVEPHAEPIVPSLVLDELAEIILRYVVMDQEQADAAALWIVMTWFIDVVEVAPLAIITAPDKACGKSIFLELLGRLVCRALSSASMSASFLFRAIVVWKPTLLIDEADTIVRDSE
jgi:putative DNA primase/helicase